MSVVESELAIRDEARIAQWLVNIPELATRPALLEALKTSHRLRRRVFQTAAAMESIALIPSRHVAGRCLALWWREASHEIYRYWEGRLRNETGSDTLFNEMYGCLRNVYINIRAKADCPCYPVKRTEHDVMREYE